VISPRRGASPTRRGAEVGDERRNTGAKSLPGLDQILSGEIRIDEIIGEALNRIKKDDPNKVENIVSSR